ncbi:serine/threonine protein kinase psk1 [Lobosporangium transversale]|uniref:Kinase-like domain-containing protein n=1 Tax=Lobosporangium transversale TaxID=64571 RepID=A0A1Y2GYC8_9FUNG|nr:kinase-like domain-containing protein [Lobosporangium transversale]KAF9906365.1 serine/threonine protein kinase psk1 [Lobosporangium transversale]ORZ23773.1 kinase-like domain-containing protein [Lobosporangium transversale]|eukprot:XP_021883587.1 kinase-like domain-containing protein [Lobosporangium transversale]
MDLFSFDHDDHPQLRERTFSVDSAQGIDSPQEAFSNLSVNSTGNNAALSRSHVNNSEGNGISHPILSPRPIAPSPAFAVALRSSTPTTSTTKMNAERICNASNSNLGLYEANNNSSKHLPAFFHQVDREQAMTPESTFRSQQRDNSTITAATATAAKIKTQSSSNNSSSQNSDNESEGVEYEVKIDQDFDAHTPLTVDSRGVSPRPGQHGISCDTLTTDMNGVKSAAVTANVSPSVGPRRPKHKMVPDDFKFLKVIGRGAYGKVYLVRHIATNALYAMKVLKKASIIVHAKDTECTMSERKILEAIRHPFIVKLHYAFQTDHRLYLILEYASGGELFTHLATERMFSEENTAFYAAQLVLALEHLHSLGIIYRDLKPENIMLNAHGDIILTDFGLSKVPLENSDGRTNTVCGTIEYMAPEVVSGKTHYDRTVDWWSLGIVVHDMLTGSPPFVASNRKKTMDAILNKKLNLPYYLSSDAKDLLTKLLKRTPSARLGYGPKGIENIKNHRFFRKINWKLLALRELDPPIVPFLSDPESVENFNSDFTSLPVQESPILIHNSSIHGFTNGHGVGVDQNGRTTAPKIVSDHHTQFSGLPVDGVGESDHHPAGIPMAKTRSSSPDRHHFQDFSYIATSHLPSLGYLDPLDDPLIEH